MIVPQRKIYASFPHTFAAVQYIQLSFGEKTIFPPHTCSIPPDV